MISFLQGTVISKTPTTLVIQTMSGLGYDVYIPPSKLLPYKTGQEVAFHTYLKVTDTALDLYGFETTEEKMLFQLLITVKGVGPKSALQMLSLGSLTDIKQAIARGDAKYLGGVKGIGKKTAERLVVELKSKMEAQGIVSHVDSGADDPLLGDVIEALVGMGYSQEEARDRVKGVATDGKSVEDVLRKALKNN